MTAPRSRRSLRSLQRRAVYLVPEEPACVAWAAFRVPHRGEGNNLAMRMRDHLGSIFDDRQFADLFSVTGQPTVSPHRRAPTTILQFAEGLSKGYSTGVKPPMLFARALIRSSRSASR